MPTPFLHVVVRGLCRRFWIVGAAAALVCGALAARAAGHVIDARYLADAPRAAATAPPPPPAPDVAPPPAPRDPAGMVARNMFCSTCAAAGPAAATTTTTTLPLVLVATNLGDRAFATLRDTTSDVQGAFAIGDRIPRIGEVAAIGGTWVDVRADAGGVARVRLLAVAPGPATAATPAPAPAGPYADRIRAIDAHTFEVDRRLVGELMSAGGAPGVRMTPITKGGALAGVKVVTARPSSIAFALGLRPGDTLSEIDGAPIASAQQLIDLVARLPDIATVHVGGSRRGAALAIDLQLR